MDQGRRPEPGVRGGGAGPPGRALSGLGLTHNRAEAEDLVQEACLAFKNFHPVTSISGDR